MAAAKVARALLVLELLDSVDETRPKRTRGKTRRWIKRREEKGNFANIVRELRFEDTYSFTEMFRMKFSTMKEILKIIKAEITPHREANKVFIMKKNSNFCVPNRKKLINKK